MQLQPSQITQSSATAFLNKETADTIQLSLNPVDSSGGVPALSNITAMVLPKSPNGYITSVDTNNNKIGFSVTGNNVLVTGITSACTGTLVVLVMAQDSLGIVIGKMFVINIASPSPVISL